MTRIHQAIDLPNQNESQPVYRLSPELISKIFLQAQPDAVLGPRLGAFMRYLVNISSITSYFRHVALGCGKLWVLVGFTIPWGADASHYRRALAMVEAFLERSQGCSLHFFFFSHQGSTDPPSDRFYSSLLELVSPHTGRVKTLTIGVEGFKSWEHLRILLTDMVNVNKLTLRTRPGGTTLPLQFDALHNLNTTPLPRVDGLHNLKELTLSGFSYDESVRDIMKRVEMLDIDPCDTDLLQWLGHSAKLKRLILGTQVHTEFSPINPKSPIRVDVVYLSISQVLYQCITARLVLPHLRHLFVTMPNTQSYVSDPQIYHHSSLRTLRIHMGNSRLSVGVFLIIMNPQLEYLQIDTYGGLSIFLPLLSELLAPSHGVPSFPGLSLQYMRLSASGFGSNLKHMARVSELLSSVLSKAPHLQLELVKCSDPITWKLVDQFPSQVKFHKRGECIPLDELYESAVGD